MAKQTISDQLKVESLDWAIAHIRKFGDTDIFPVPFEYEAIQISWNGIRNELTHINIKEYEGRPFQRILIPKPQGGFRVAIQLDPIDALLYTALVYEAAQLIEQSRAPKESKIACSYRVEIDSSGQLFRKDSGWNDFHERSASLAESGQYSYVITADISDFYNQISHHRVRNALELSGVLSSRAENFENFLMNLTRGQSRGIPVGPSASILLAEACLNDVDSFLLRKGYTHVRYVDDFRIFCPNLTKAYKALHDLSEYLYTAHRLTLQAGKTEIKPLERFVAHELFDPERLEEQTKANKIDSLLKAFSVEREEVFQVFLRYSNPLDLESLSLQDQEISKEEVNKIARENILELFTSCLTENILHLGLARYLLRRALLLRTNVLHESVLNNLDKLAPVMRDAMIYLSKTTTSSNSPYVGERLIEFYRKSEISFLPYMGLWLSYILANHFASDFERDINNICDSLRIQLGTRPFALLARKLKYLDWVREQKETWQNNNPWDKRAIIWSASVLSEDERRYWLARVQNAGDLLDKAIATAALSIKI
uniref:reverse transcriptase domain-containing protein n=1 Tax=Trichocoleus desertorum TaxID=1481672 RepID=UPI0025B6290D|nr:reverse transcriptase domain-containing protein [Trichocoleus desertorum]